MTIKDLEPKIVWKYFHEITQVPRPSKRERKINSFEITEKRFDATIINREKASRTMRNVNIKELKISNI